MSGKLNLSVFADELGLLERNGSEFIILGASQRPVEDYLKLALAKITRCQTSQNDVRSGKVEFEGQSLSGCAELSIAKELSSKVSSLKVDELRQLPIE